MCRTIFLLLTALCLFAHVQAQVWPLVSSPNVVNTTGGTINLAGNEFIEYSVGEMAVASLNLNGNIVGFTQGLLQPRLETPFIINTHESFDEKYGFKCYPNPVTDLLTVETTYHDFTSVQFTNMEGRLIQEIRFYYTPIDCTSLQPGTYYVRFFSANKPESKTIKLFKQ